MTKNYGKRLKCLKNFVSGCRYNTLSFHLGLSTIKKFLRIFILIFFLPDIFNVALTFISGNTI